MVKKITITSVEPGREWQEVFTTPEDVKNEYHRAWVDYMALSRTPVVHTGALVYQIAFVNPFEGE